MATKKNDLQKQQSATSTTFGSFVNSFVTAEDFVVTGKALLNSALGYNDTSCTAPGSTPIKNVSAQEQQHQQKLRNALRRSRSRSKLLAKQHAKQEQPDETTMFSSNKSIHHQRGLTTAASFQSESSVSTMPATNVAARRSFDPGASTEIRVDADVGTQYRRNISRRSVSTPSVRRQFSSSRVDATGNDADDRVVARRHMTARLRLGSRSNRHEENTEGVSLRRTNSSVSHNNLGKEDREARTTQIRRRRSLTGDRQVGAQEKGVEDRAARLRGIRTRHRAGHSSLHNEQPANTDDDDRLDKISREQQAQLLRDSERERVARQRSVQRRRDLEEETEHEEWLAKRIRRDKAAAAEARREERNRALQKVRRNTSASSANRATNDDDIDELMGQRVEEYGNKTPNTKQRTAVSLDGAQRRGHTVLEPALAHDELMGPQPQPQAVAVESNHDELMGSVHNTDDEEIVKPNQEVDKAHQHDEVLRSDLSQSEIVEPSCNSELKGEVHPKQEEDGLPDQADREQEASHDDQNVTTELPEKLAGDTSLVNEETVMRDTSVQRLQEQQESHKEELTSGGQEKKLLSSPLEKAKIEARDQASREQESSHDDQYVTTPLPEKPAENTGLVNEESVMQDTSVQRLEKQQEPNKKELTSGGQEKKLLSSPSEKTNAEAQDQPDREQGVSRDDQYVTTPLPEKPEENTGLVNEESVIQDTSVQRLEEQQKPNTDELTSEGQEKKLLSSPSEEANVEAQDQPDREQEASHNVTTPLPEKPEDITGFANEDIVMQDTSVQHLEEEDESSKAELTSEGQEKKLVPSPSEEAHIEEKVVSPDTAPSSSIVALSTYQAQAAQTVFDCIALRAADNDDNADIAFNPIAIAAYQHELDVLAMDESSLVASADDLELKHILANPAARDFYLSMSQTLCNAVTGCESLAASTDSEKDSKAFHSFRAQLVDAISRKGVRTAQKNIINPFASVVIGKVVKELRKQQPTSTSGYKLSCSSLLSKLLSSNEIKYCRQVSNVCLFAALADTAQGMTEVMKLTARLVLRSLNGTGVVFKDVMNSKFGQSTKGTSSLDADALLNTTAKKCGVRAATDALRMLMKPKKDKTLTKIMKHINSKRPLAEALASAILDVDSSFRTPFGRQQQERLSASARTPLHANPQQPTTLCGTTSTTSNHGDRLGLGNHINTLVVRQQMTAWMELPPGLSDILSLLNEDAERKNDIIAELASVNADLLRRIEALEQHQHQADSTQAA